MRVQHNIMAMNAYRNYSGNTSAMQKNLERLSSGYKINRAGDDAAGLAISEKMRAQITGLEVAQKNAKDGISLVQTAEGALTEVHDMLNRMVELATQSANGTYHNDTDRDQLQKEIDQLKTEINRIADSANFNGIQLLDGSMAVRDATHADTEYHSYKGMDRILSSVMGEGETAWGVNNLKTVLDYYAGTETKGAFSIDFSTLKFVAARIPGLGEATSATGTSELLGSFTISIGDKTVIISAQNFASGVASKVTFNGSKVTCSITGGDLAQAFMNALKNKTDGSKASKAIVTINGVEWKASISGSKVKFTQLNLPRTVQEAITAFDVNVKFSGGEDSEFTLSMTGNLQDGVKVEQKGVPQGANRGAATVFELKEEDIVDGAYITLGKGSSAIHFTLAVGRDSLYADKQSTATEKVIKLTDLEEGAAHILQIALSRIGAAASKVTFTTKNSKGSDVTASFAITVTNNGIAVQRIGSVAKESDVKFKTLEDLAKNFRLTYNEMIAAKDAQTGLTLQIGDTAQDFNKLVVSINDCHVKAIGVADIDISTQEGAAEAVDKIKDAINYVSDVRGTLGATQNRLDHTINNLSVMTENIQDAESTIRDTDVAEEMMAYTKNNILIQAAQAMLAQANQVPQGVLQLLQ